MKLTLFSIFLALAVYAGAQHRQYYAGDDISTDSLLAIDDNAATVAIEARCAMPEAKEGFGEDDRWWGIAWNYVSPRNYDYVVIRPYNSDFGSIHDRRVMAVEYGSVTGGDAVVTLHETMESGVNMTKGFNSLLVEWGNGTVRVFVGSKGLKKVVEHHSALPSGGNCKLICGNTSLAIGSLVVECGEDKAKSLATTYEMEPLMRSITVSGDKREGTWQYLDRETDDSRARSGGSYSLAIVNNGTGYDLLYLGGARVNGAEWKPLMLKGTLIPTPFENHYNLIWYDSTMTLVEDESYATFSEEGILSLEFPLHKSRMRFYRNVDISL